MATLKRKTNNGYEPLPAMVVRKTNAENGNGIGTCDTSSGTALTVSLTGYELVTNGFVAVTFTNDVPANATLNVNNKGAKPIIYKGSAITADTIKADDTVMFCYDGSSYVVTSLGGGNSGPVYFPEFVTIHLSSTEGDDDTNLIGTTIVVTNDDTSTTLLSTTWQGEDIATTVEYGVNYTVTVGSIPDYYIQANYQSYTAVSALSRTITFKYFFGVIDLGLPSGTKWYNRNLGADSPSDSGLYFSWGNINGYPANSSYSFTQANYAQTQGYSVSASITADSGYDAARETLGYPFRMPSRDEVLELKNNCTWAAATVGGKAGVMGTSKINGNQIFFVFSGRYDTKTCEYPGEYWFGWTSYLEAAHRVTYGQATLGGISTMTFNDYGYLGNSIRPVI